MSATTSTVEVIESTPAGRFTRALARGRLELPFCTRCESLVWYPRTRCPVCMSTVTQWVEVSGRGTIYSFTVNRRPPRGHGGEQLVIAYVEIDEGPRILANVVDTPIEQVRIGTAVQLAAGKSGEVRLAFTVTGALSRRDGAGPL